MNNVPEALARIIDEFQEATPRERLEYLLEFSAELPDLPDRLLARRDSMEMVHECQTPVFLHTEVKENRVHFYLDIPAESPTVRGYAAILLEGLANATPQEVLETPEDIYMRLGLHEAITPQRIRGLHALLIHMKRQIRKLQ